MLTTLRHLRICCDLSGLCWPYMPLAADNLRLSELRIKTLIQCYSAWVENSLTHLTHRLVIAILVTLCLDVITLLLSLARFP